jgi:hypothetical protein
VRIKAVIFNHNRPQTADVLFEQLSTAFDTALFDSGSEPEQVSHLTTHQFHNLYWTGCWTKSFELFGDYDVIWGVGGDCTLKSKPENYLHAMKSAHPFGLWSPTISGRAHDYMQPKLALARIFSVLFLEGMAFAISKQLWEAAAPLDDSDYIGYSHDRRLSYLARKLNLKNILDGRVELQHPPSESYDREEARRLMDVSLTKLFGSDWSETLDWWPQRQLSFMGNAVSEVRLEDGIKKFSAPFHRK